MDPDCGVSRVLPSAAVCWYRKGFGIAKEHPLEQTQHIWIYDGGVNILGDDPSAR